jgi:polar amino acid transport system substrate-binding protein
MAKWAQLALWCCAALAGLPAAAVTSTPEPIRICTSDLPPFSMEGAPAAPGALYEMVAELIRRTRVPANIEFVPWQRAIYLSTSQGRTALFPLTRSPEREHQYRWLARLYHEHFLFMSRAGSHFDVRHPELGKERRIGVLRGSLMVKVLRDSGYTHVVEAASVNESLRFLRRGIVDAVFGDRSIYRASLHGRAESDYLMSEPMRTTTTWLGGSLDLSEADAELFQKAMKEMIEDGSYAQILKKYELAPGP